MYCISANAFRVDNVTEFRIMSTTGIMIVNCTVIEFIEMIKFIMFYS